MSPTTNIDSEIRVRIETFAAELGTLVRQSAVEAVRGALGDGTAAPRRRGHGRPRKATAAPARRGPGRPPKAAKTPRGRRGRRSPEAVSETAELLQAHVRANPGQRLEEIGRELRRPTSELKLPLSKLMAAGSLRTEGQKRGTRYYAGGGKAGAAKAAGRKSARKSARGTRKKRRATKRKTRRGTRAGQTAAAVAAE